jgi:hypothetical protein
MKGFWLVLAILVSSVPMLAAEEAKEVAKKKALSAAQGESVEEAMGAYKQVVLNCMVEIAGNIKAAGVDGYFDQSDSFRLLVKDICNARESKGLRELLQGDVKMPDAMYGTNSRSGLTGTVRLNNDESPEFFMNWVPLVGTHKINVSIRLETGGKEKNPGLSVEALQKKYAPVGAKLLQLVREQIEERLNRSAKLRFEAERNEANRVADQTDRQLNVARDELKNSINNLARIEATLYGSSMSAEAAERANGTALLHKLDLDAELAGLKGRREAIQEQIEMLSQKVAIANQNDEVVKKLDEVVSLRKQVVDRLKPDSDERQQALAEVAKSEVELAQARRLAGSSDKALLERLQVELSQLDVDEHAGLARVELLEQQRKSLTYNPARVLDKKADVAMHQERVARLCKQLLEANDAFYIHELAFKKVVTVELIGLETADEEPTKPEQK